MGTRGTGWNAGDDDLVRGHGKSSFRAGTCAIERRGTSAPQCTSDNPDERTTMAGVLHLTWPLPFRIRCSQDTRESVYGTLTRQPSESSAARANKLGQTTMCLEEPLAARACGW